MSDPVEQFPRGHKLSEPAARLLHEFKAELEEWPAYLETVTSSSAIELLVWWWRQTRQERKTQISPLDHRPETRRGRKAGQNQIANARPAKMRADDAPPPLAY
jgi:hypothetical protein